MERSILKLPLSKLCAVPLALQNIALFEGKKMAKMAPRKVGACAMTTNFSTIKFALSKFYCRGASHEKQHFGRFSSLPLSLCFGKAQGKTSINQVFLISWASQLPELQQRKNFIRCRVENVEDFREISCSHFP